MFLKTPPPTRWNHSLAPPQPLAGTRSVRCTHARTGLRFRETTSPFRCPAVADNTQPPTPTRTAREVIDAAIRENRPWEWLSYALTVAFAVVGLAVLVAGAYHGEGLVALSGAAASALFWPAMRNAVTIRSANIRIRMFEIALGSAKTPREAAALIREAMGYDVPREK